jgi:phosphopantetheinyl transferase
VERQPSFERARTPQDALSRKLIATLRQVTMITHEIDFKSSQTKRNPPGKAARHLKDIVHVEIMISGV